jgi:phage terminase large subunit
MPDIRSACSAIGRWRHDIVAFVREVLQVEPDAWQIDAIEAFASPAVERRRLSLQACAGPGKSAVMAWMALWFMAVQGDAGEHPKGAAVAITVDNLQANFWPELAKWQARSDWLKTAFTWTQTRYFATDHPETWFLSARSWPKTANPDEQGATLSGLHSKYVACFVDESGSVPTTVLRAAEQSLSSTTFGKIVQAGNPISTEGMLYAAASQFRHLWHVIAITGDPDDPKRAPRVDIEWARQQIAAYGRDNPWVGSYILGKFPASSFNTLLSVEEVQAAMAKHYRQDAFQWAQKRLGVDVARFGDDRTVIFPRQGVAAFKPVTMRVQRTDAIAARVSMAIATWGCELTLVDDTGHWGHGVVDGLIAAGLPVLPIIASDPAIDPRYKNRRAEMWLGMAAWVKAGGALPNIPELVGELTVPTYTFVAGKFQLEDKDLVKKRLGRSPDLADALAQTFAIPDQPSETLARMQKAHHVAHDFDPFAAQPEGRVLHEFDPFEAKV